MIEPTSKFLHLNCYGLFDIPPPPSQNYHITLTHTCDVGKGYELEEDKLREWLESYERMRSRYYGKRARLGLDKWGVDIQFTSAIRLKKKV